VLSGLASNYASTPDSAALSITGDIDIKAKVAMADWTPSEVKYIVGKWGSASTRSYSLGIGTDGKIRLFWSTDGSNSNSADSTVATGITDGATKWVRATLDVNDGAGNRVAKFYTSDDGSSWTQLGTTVTVGITITIFDSTSAVEVGTNNTGSATGALIGTVYRTIIQSAYDTANNTSSLVFDADFSTQTADALAFTESSSNAATVTINTTRYSYGVPGLGWTATAVASGPLNSDRFNTFVVTKALTVDMWGTESTTGPASSSIVYFGLYAADDNFQPTGSPLIADNLTVGTSATGIFRKQITPVTLQPGAYVLGLNTSVQFSHRTFSSPSPAILGGVGSSPFMGRVSVLSRTAGTFGAAPVLNDFATTNVACTHYIFLRWKAA